MGYIEGTYRIGKRSSKNRPLVIELLSKRMAAYLKENSHVFQGTRLFLSEYLDDNARRERNLLREEMLKPRKQEMHAVIRNNQLFIDGKIANKADDTPDDKIDTKKCNPQEEQLIPQINNNGFRNHTCSEDEQEHFENKDEQFKILFQISPTNNTS